jgi:hypothetical protein
MNKIQRAIHETKLKLEDKRTESLCVSAEIRVLTDMLRRLESIENADSIPHIEGTPATLDHAAVTAFTPSWSATNNC